MTHEIIQILSAFAGSFGFGLTFNLRGRNLALASLGGLLDWAVYLLVGLFTDFEPIQIFFASLFLGLYAEVVARIFKAPTTVFLAVGVIPLIPGSALFLAGSEIFMGSWPLINHYLIIALYTAVAITGGLIIAIFITQLILGIYRRYFKEKKQEIKLVP